MNCTIDNCDVLALGDTYPPLCPVHLDLDILVDFTLARKEQPTVEIVQAHYRAALSNSSDWVITAEQIAELLTEYLEAKKIALPATTTENATLVTTLLQAANQ